MKPCFVTEIIKKICEELGIPILIEPLYGYVARITRPDGGMRYFRSSCLDLNTLGSSEIAQDKDYATYFMKDLGYQTIPGQRFLSEEFRKRMQDPHDQPDPFEYAHSLGYPVIVKPNSRTQGRGVMKVHSDEELVEAIAAVTAMDRIYLIQQAVTWRDYRILVLEDEIISAYERTPLVVRGNSGLMVSELLVEKQRAFQAQGRDTILRHDDPRISTRLSRDGRSLESVVPTDEVWQLLDNANLSSGGDARDVTNTIHPQFADLAVRLTRDMGLRYCGVDIFVNGDLSTATDEYAIIEINAAPGADNYAAIGIEQQQRVEAMYRKIVLAMLK